MTQPGPTKIAGLRQGSYKNVNRAAMQKALLKSEEWLRLAAEGSSELGLWYWDELRRGLHFDAKTREMYGVSVRRKVTLQTFIDALHPDDRARVIRTWRHAVEKELPYSVGMRALRPDGSVRWIHGRGIGHYGRAGKPLCMVGVDFDVTERRQGELERVELAGRLINAQELERSRLARELHDDFSQRMAIIARRLEKVAAAVEDSESAIETQLNELRVLVDKVGGDLHTLSHRLHSSALEILGLAQNIGPFCADFAKEHGIQIDFESADIAQSVPPEVTLCLFRIVQEALRNVVKHSHASNVEVRLKGNSETVSLTLSDNGVGFDVSQKCASMGIGIQSMKERTRMLGGTFEVRSHRMQGTQITVTVPLNRVGDVLNVFAQ